MMNPVRGMSVNIEYSVCTSPVLTASHFRRSAHTMHDFTQYCMRSACQQVTRAVKIKCTGRVKNHFQQDRNVARKFEYDGIVASTGEPLM
jgi:hypothetical protein